MEKTDLKFVVLFIATLGFLFFALGTSITGNVVQTAYCNEKGCFDFCKTNSDCIIGRCCEEKTFGICKQECDQEFVLTPDIDVVYPLPYTELPQKTGNPLLYSSLIFLTLLIGTLYFLAGKKIHIKL